MRASTYWNAYKLAMQRILIFTVMCDHMQKMRYIRLAMKLDERLTRLIERMELLARQGEIDGGRNA